MSRTSGVRVKAEEFRRQCVVLRAQGHSYREIAEITRRPISRVYYAIRTYLEQIPAEEIELVRRMEMERLDRAVRLVMERIEEGDLAAVDRLVKLIDLRMRMVGGYAAQPVDLSRPIQLVWPDGTVVVRDVPAAPALTE